MYPIENVSYSIDIGVVISANTYSHIYAVAPIWKRTTDKPYWFCVPIGILGNTPNGVQLQCAYNYGDRVFVLYPNNYVKTGGSSLCFIIGGAPAHIFVGQSADEYVASTQWDENNLSVETFTGFEYLQRELHLDKYTPTAVGHGVSDMLPGDFEATGNRTSLMIGDYLAGFRGTATEIYIDSIQRRLVEDSLLKTTSTAAEDTNISLVGTTVIDSIYTRGKLSEPTTDKSKKAWYRTVQQSGDLLYGDQKTLLAEDGKTPLAKDYTGYNGTRYIYTAGRLCLGKIPSMESPVYVGPMISKELKKTKLVENNLSRQLEPQDKEGNWNTKINEKLIGGNKELLIDSWYPASFLEQGLAEYPDDPSPVEVADSIEETPIKVNHKHSYISFEDDGSIKLVDGWGSYILLSHGNIELHAMNNLFMVSARDMLSFAGANHTEYANGDLSIQAYKGDLRAQAGSNIKLEANSKTGGITLEGRNEVRVIANTYKNDSALVVFTIRNSDTQAIGGQVFQVLAPQGQINLSGEHVRLSGGDITLTAQLTALSLSANVTIAGDVGVHGGLSCGGGSVSIPVITPEGKAMLKPYSPGTNTEIINARGGLRVSENLITKKQVLAAGLVCGGGFSLSPKNSPQKEIATDQNLSGVRSTINKTLSVPAPKIPEFKDDKLISKLALDNLSDYRFNFGKESKNCVFVVPHALPRGGTTTITNTGYVDAKNMKSYIYPGKGFWESNGLKLNSDNHIGFNRLPNAADNKVD